jgi:hypothetical protein
MFVMYLNYKQYSNKMATALDAEIIALEAELAAHRA